MTQESWQQAFYVVLGLLSGCLGFVIVLLIKHVIELGRAVASLDKSVAVLTQIVNEISNEQIQPIRKRIHALEGWRKQVDETLIRLGISKTL